MCLFAEGIQTFRDSLLSQIVELEIEDDALSNVGALEHDAHFGLTCTALKHNLGQTTPPTCVGQRLPEQLVAYLGIDVRTLQRVAILTCVTNPKAVVAQLVLTVLQSRQLLTHLVVAKRTA